jgi:hypothetical protein
LFCYLYEKKTTWCGARPGILSKSRVAVRLPVSQSYVQRKIDAENLIEKNRAAGQAGL